MSEIKTFKVWCEDNGKRWTGSKSFEEFKQNAEAYERYRESKGCRMVLIPRSSDLPESCDRPTSPKVDINNH